MLARSLRLAKNAMAGREILEGLLGEKAEPRADIVYELAKCFEDLRMWNRADEELGRFAKEFPSDPRAPKAFLALARARAKAGRLEEALSVLNRFNQDSAIG